MGLVASVLSLVCDDYCCVSYPQDIECMCVDAGMVVSASLDGDIKVWDTNPMRRRCITTISRRLVHR